MTQLTLKPAQWKKLDYFSMSGTQIDREEMQNVILRHLAQALDIFDPKMRSPYSNSKIQPFKTNPTKIGQYLVTTLIFKFLGLSKSPFFLDCHDKPVSGPKF